MNNKPAYTDALEKARKAALDRRSKFSTPTAKETREATVEGLVRPRARPAELEIPEASGGTTTGVGLALMEAMYGDKEEPKTSAPTTSPRPSARQGDDIYQGLVDRGLPEHVARGFVMNMRDESGLDSNINERDPLVEGSRGGFGLYQVTGPRRVAFEAFAESRGKGYGDKDTQLDFLMHEMATTEKHNAADIMRTSTAGEAASVIVNKFLRPSEEHRARRSARYLAQNN